MGKVFESKTFSDAEKLEIFKDACKRTPLACKGNPLKHQFVDAVCSDSFGIARGILEGTVGAGLDDKVTVIPRKGDAYNSPLEDFRVSLGGFAAYVGRTEILKYMMYDMPESDLLHRATVMDKMYSVDNPSEQVDITLYEVGINGRRFDDLEYPLILPFTKFIKEEKKKWDASHGVADKIKNDLIKSFNGGAPKQISDSKTLALEEQFSGLGAVVGLTGFAELAKHLKSS